MISVTPIYTYVAQRKLQLSAKPFGCALCPWPSPFRGPVAPELWCFPNWRFHMLVFVLLFDCYDWWITLGAAEAP